MFEIMKGLACDQCFQVLPLPSPSSGDILPRSLSLLHPLLHEASLTLCWVSQVLMCVLVIAIIALVAIQFLNSS